MAANGISTLATKELRQIAKLDLAAAKRNQSYNIDLLPTKYVGNVAVKNTNAGGLVDGRPWTTDTLAPSYALEFRSITGDNGPGNIITTCNEGDLIWFSIIGTNVPYDDNAYLQFGGANITNQDAQWPFSENVLDPIPYNVSGSTTNGAPLGINPDNVTEGNETLTLSWIVLNDVVATVSITIVDTSQST